MNNYNQWTRSITVWDVGNIALPLLLIFAMAPGDLDGQDRITVRDERTGKITQFQALVLGWDSSRLAYSGNGRENSISASRVVEVDYTRSETQTSADQKFEAGQFLQAYQDYENAIADEPRDWIKVEMISRQLRCAVALNRHAETLKAFFEIQKATPRSRYFHLIPIPWDQTRPDGSMIQVYQDWMSSADEAQSLIAASWLLMADEATSTAKLKDLARSEDPRIAHLATAQLWRMQTIAAKNADLQRWTAAIDRMPENLQAGPRFQVAMAMKLMNRNGDRTKLNQALIGMMQIPVLFPEQYQLSGAALGQAHQMLVAAGRTDEAELVMTELKRDFGFSNAAISSGGRIEKMDQ